MPFIADDLGAWLIGLLADAGRKKVTALVLGSEQERALRKAATAAVQSTAGELRPDDAEQAAQLARVVDQVFTAPENRSILDTMRLRQAASAARRAQRTGARRTPGHARPSSPRRRHGRSPGPAARLLAA